MLSEFKINKKFLESVWQKQSRGKPISQEEIAEFATLLETLLLHQNQPKKRNGYTKAKVLSKWLEKRGVAANIIPVKNLDTRKKANAHDKWYIVEATVGEEKFAKNTINGVLLVHHDQIAKSINEFQRSQTPEKITYPWILDDSVHVAAAMIEFVRFANWWRENAGKFDKKISIKLLISDGEEMNTLGMRGMLAKWKKEKLLHPIDFMIIGESTGENDEVPGVAYTNSGKVLGTIKSVDKGIKPCHSALDFVVRFRTAQKYIRMKSEVSPFSKIEKVKFSKASSTYGRIAEESEFFWEIRTNNLFGTQGSYGLLTEIMTAPLGKLALYLMEINEYEAKKGSKYNLNFEEVYKYIRIGGNRMVQIKTDRSYHPGAYDPYKMDDIYSALEVLLFSMSRDELCQIEEIYFGDSDKPNTVGNSLYLVFGEKVDLDQIIGRIVNGKKNLNKSVYELFQNYIRLLPEEIKWKVEMDELVPARDAIGNYEDNKWLADIARTNLSENIGEVTGKKADVPLTVFNAMHDGGPTTYDDYREKLWKRGENVIVLGTGDFGTLHGDEYLTNETFLYGILQYRGLLGKTVEKVRGLH